MRMYWLVRQISLFLKQTNKRNPEVSKNMSRHILEERQHQVVVFSLIPADSCYNCKVPAAYFTFTKKKQKKIKHFLFVPTTQSNQIHIFKRNFTKSKRKLNNANTGVKTHVRVCCLLFSALVSLVLLIHFPNIFFALFL